MSKQKFFASLQQEVKRIDDAHISKRSEKIIESFTKEPNPKAIISGKKYSIFNSNDYLGLRHNAVLKKAEHETSEACGTGPGAVRFISGSFKVHRDLEKALAKFHGRDDAMVFSSAFATNLAVLFSLTKGQSKDSVISSNTLVISDELNHRSIIDGIRLSNLPSEQKPIFKHMDMNSLAEVLENNIGKYDRVLVVTDGVFSMLGEYQDLKAMQNVINKYDEKYPQGIISVVDDCHGVAAFGETGRGTEEVTGVKANVLVGTLGKGFGADGGYVVADQVVIDYLRESSATYIYSNSISPGTAAAALAAVELLDQKTGKELLENSRNNVAYLKKLFAENNFSLACDSIHPIQPLLIGDTAKTKEMTKKLFDKGYIVTNINYPVVPKGRDELRIQISATQSKEDIDNFVEALKEVI